MSDHDLLMEIGKLRKRIAELEAKKAALRSALSLYAETDGNIEVFKTMEQYDKAMERAYNLAIATLGETE